MSSLDPDDVKYTFRWGDDPELQKGEIRLLGLLSEGLDRYVGSDATPEERQTSFIAMVEEDPEMATYVERLHEMSRCHSGSVVSGLISLAEEEASEEGRS